MPLLFSLGHLSRVKQCGGDGVAGLCVAESGDNGRLVYVNCDDVTGRPTAVPVSDLVSLVSQINNAPDTLQQQFNVYYAMSQTLSLSLSLFLSMCMCLSVCLVVHHGLGAVAPVPVNGDLACHLSVGNGKCSRVQNRHP